MGAGIAQISAQAGYHVYLSDIELEIATKGKEGISRQLDRLVEKDKIEQRRDKRRLTDRAGGAV